MPNFYDIVINIFDYSDAIARKFKEGREYRRHRFGSILGEAYYWFGIVDTATVQRYHLNINFWTRQEAMEWRDSYKSRFGKYAEHALVCECVVDGQYGTGDLLGDCGNESAE